MSFLENESTTLIQSGTTAILSGTLSYLYLGNAVNVNAFGVQIPPFAFMAIIGGVSEFIQNNVKDGLEMVGLDNKKLESLGRFSDPFVVGLTSAGLVGLNNIVSTGGIGNLSMNTFLIPFAIGAGSSLVGGYVSNSIEPTIEDII